MGGGCLWCARDKQRAVKRFSRRIHGGVVGQCSLGAWSLLLLMFLEREKGQRRWFFFFFNFWGLALQPSLSFFWNQLGVIADSQMCGWNNLVLLIFRYKNTRNKLWFRKMLWANYCNISCLFFSPGNACPGPIWRQAPGHDHGLYVLHSVEEQPSPWWSLLCCPRALPGEIKPLLRNSRKSQDCSGHRRSFRTCLRSWTQIQPLGQEEARGETSPAWITNLSS